jgi:hypothetical protein
MSAPCSEEPPFPVGPHDCHGRAEGLGGIAEDGGPLLGSGESLDARSGC